MAQLAVVLLALFARMERTYTIERAAHARAVAVAKGRRVGRPVLVDPDKLAYAAHLRQQGHTIAEIVAKTGIARTSLYRHLPSRPPPAVTADGTPAVPRLVVLCYVAETAHGTSLSDFWCITPKMSVHRFLAQYF